MRCVPGAWADARPDKHLLRDPGEIHTAPTSGEGVPGGFALDTSGFKMTSLPHSPVIRVGVGTQRIQP